MALQTTHGRTMEIPRDDLSDFFEELQLRPHGFGELQSTCSAIRENFALSQYVLVYLLQGRLNLYRNGVRHCAEQGDVLLLGPFASYSADCQNAGELCCICLYFDVGPDYLRREFARLVTDSRLVFHPEDELIGRMLREALGHREQREGFSRTVRNVLEQVLMELAGEIWGERPLIRLPCTLQQQKIIQQSARYVLENIQRPVRIRDIAAELQISESRLNKTFNDVLGMPPSRYFMNMKMKRAEELLLTTDKTVEEISGMLGLSSAFHLSRVFKETFGAAPSEARKAAKYLA